MLEMKFENGMYILTKEFVKNELEVHYKDDETLDKRIKANSRKIYNYIYSHSYSANRPLIEKLLNNTPEGYKFLKDVLLSQMEADLETGYNDLTKQPAINMANFNTIDRNLLFINQISPDTEQILDNSRAYFKGINILYQGPLHLLGGF